MNATKFAMTRRGMMSNSLLLGIGCTSPAFAADAPSRSRVVETRSGRVRGTVSNGVLSFKGLAYGRFAGRFLPARAVEPWIGVKDAMKFGPMSFQPVWSKADVDQMPEMPRVYRGIALPELGLGRSEQPFTLNIWTRAVDQPAKKMPVMVWLHGGGFSVGTSAARCTDGTNLALHEEVVIVSSSTARGMPRLILLKL